MRAAVILVGLLSTGLVSIGPASSTVQAVELVQLQQSNWRAYAPRGKEVDCIYGDFVLRNELVTLVIAQPHPQRNANMTVRNVGFAIIDLTERQRANDQLSAFYPASAAARFPSSESLHIEVDGESGSLRDDTALQGKQISIACEAERAAGKPRITVRYTLADGDPAVTVETIYTNDQDQPLTEEAKDTVRADRTFAFGVDAERKMFWAHDEWFRQAYGIQCLERSVVQSGSRGVVIEYQQDGSSQVTIPAGQQVVLTRRLLVAPNLLALKGLASLLLEQPVQPVQFTLRDPAGPVAKAQLTVRQNDQLVGVARTGRNGQLSTHLPVGEYQVAVTAPGRPPIDRTLAVSEGTNDFQLELAECGYVRARIVDPSGQPIPCKVAFHGVEGTESPDFGPDSGIAEIRNLRYTPNGRFRQRLGPGKYEVIVSYGTEYDAVFQTLEVRAGEVTDLRAQLERSVRTDGWISSDFHSHSTPSGDNVSHQRGRVLNLLCEHIEFAPCTEHNRISSYVPHLRALEVQHLMATCSGLELTGSPLPINHQNAFPLRMVPRTQDNGAPQTDENPLVQIERLAMWEDGAEKLVQINHPNLVQMLGDRDTDGTADGGFAGMFEFMDVIEVHPPQHIFLKPGTPEFTAAKNVPIFNWMQMLNLGYRAAGVVNTDAHYHFHGSGGLRNFIRSSTDDPAQVSTLEMARAATKGQLVMSNGPFLEVDLYAPTGQRLAGPGEEIHLPEGKGRLQLRVQCPNWFDINRVQVFINGRADETLNYTRRDTPEHFSNENVRFKAEIPLQLATDAHVIVAAGGEGLKLGRVLGPDWGEQMPVAVANPIFVDVDGQGFKPNGDLLDQPLPLEKTTLPGAAERGAAADASPAPGAGD